MTGASSKSGRAADLDLFKTLLVWGMISAHCIQLLAFRPKPGAAMFSDFINLITFSGFLFAFGLGVGMSGSAGKSWLDRLRPVLLLLLATYVSEVAFEVLVDRKPLGPELLWNIVTLSRLCGWSEFLASFAVLYLIIALARPLLVFIATHWPLLIAAVAACFASTLIISNRGVPGLATLIGTTEFASFPLLPYLPWFLVGIAFGRQRALPRMLEWALATVATAIFAFVFWRAGGELPGRFPPTILWIIGPALPLLVYVVVTRGIARWPIPSFLLGPGRHVLAALLVSNLIIFGLRWWFAYRLGAWWWTPILAISIIAVVTLWAFVLDRGKAVRA